MKYFSPSLLDGSVTTAKIADDSVTTAKIVNLAVTNPKIGALAVAGPNLQSSSVGGAKLATDAVTQVKIATSEISLAGSVGGNSSDNLTLAPYTFWPMIHVANRDKLRVTGHSVDSPGADNARLAITNNAAGAEDYDLDYRSID